MQALQYISTVPSPVLPYLFMDCPILHNVSTRPYLQSIFEPIIFCASSENYLQKLLTLCPFLCFHTQI